jgi:hypothetical protein
MKEIDNKIRIAQSLTCHGGSYISSAALHAVELSGQLPSRFPSGQVRSNLVVETIEKRVLDRGGLGTKVRVFEQH